MYYKLISLPGLNVTEICKQGNHVEIFAASDRGTAGVQIAGHAARICLS